MSWQIARQMLQAGEPGQVEYRIFQRERRSGTPSWRQHQSGQRFDSVENALFNERQGARAALKGTAQYAKDRYASGPELHVAYVAAWLQGRPFAFLARQSTPDPEVTVVRVEDVDTVNFQDESELTAHLAAIFGDGARMFGVKFLSDQRQIIEL